MNTDFAGSIIFFDMIVADVINFTQIHVVKQMYKWNFSCFLQEKKPIPEPEDNGKAVCDMHTRFFYQAITIYR